VPVPMDQYHQQQHHAVWSFRSGTVEENQHTATCAWPFHTTTLLVPEPQWQSTSTPPQQQQQQQQEWPFHTAVPLWEEDSQNENNSSNSSQHQATKGLTLQSLQQFAGGENLKKQPQQCDQEASSEADDTASTVCLEPGSWVSSADWSDAVCSPSGGGHHSCSNSWGVSSPKLLSPQHGKRWSVPDEASAAETASVSDAESRNKGSLKSRARAVRNFKTQPCKFFARGTCTLGGDCCFVHDPTEQRETAGKSRRQRQKKDSISSSTRSSVSTSSGSGGSDSSALPLVLPSKAAEKVLLFADRMAGDCYLVVKNSFLDIEMPESSDAASALRRRRSSSVPCLQAAARSS